MKRLMTWMGVAAIASAVAATANEKMTITIPSVTSGKCAITLLEADGIHPMVGASLKLQAVKDGSEAAATTSDKVGKCVVKLEDGRYILSVDGKNLTLVDASKDGQMAWCRIVVSENPMLVGGQVAGEVVAVSGGLFGAGTTAGTIAIVAGTAVVVVGGTAYAIDDYQPSGTTGGGPAVVTVSTPVVPVSTGSRSRPVPTSP